MRWPPWKRDHGQVERLAEAAEAKQAADAELKRVREQWPAVHDARAKLDGLGTQIERAMRGRA